MENCRGACTFFMFGLVGFLVSMVVLSQKIMSSGPTVSSGLNPSLVASRLLETRWLQQQVGFPTGTSLSENGTFSGESAPSRESMPSGDDTSANESASENTRFMESGPPVYDMAMITYMPLKGTTWGRVMAESLNSTESVFARRWSPISHKDFESYVGFSRNDGVSFEAEAVLEDSVSAEDTSLSLHNVRLELVTPSATSAEESSLVAQTVCRGWDVECRRSFYPVWGCAAGSYMFCVGDDSNWCTCVKYSCHAANQSCPNGSNPSQETLGMCERKVKRAASSRCPPGNHAEGLECVPGEAGASKFCPAEGQWLLEGDWCVGTLVLPEETCARGLVHAPSLLENCRCVGIEKKGYGIPVGCPHGFGKLELTGDMCEEPYKLASVAPESSAPAV